MQSVGKTTGRCKFDLHVSFRRGRTSSSPSPHFTTMLRVGRFLMLFSRSSKSNSLTIVYRVNDSRYLRFQTLVVALSLCIISIQCGRWRSGPKRGSTKGSSTVIGPLGPLQVPTLLLRAHDT
jgi:hypothetical protein